MVVELVLRPSATGLAVEHAITVMLVMRLASTHHDALHAPLVDVKLALSFKLLARCFEQFAVCVCGGFFDVCV